MAVYNRLREIGVRRGKSWSSVRIWGEDWRKQLTIRWERAFKVKAGPAGSCSASSTQRSSPRAAIQH